MPSSERWHCTLTTKEKERNPEMHIFDGEPYLPKWGDESVSMRQSETVPLDEALSQAEWVGSKIKQIATMAAQHSAEKIPRPREWRLNHIGGQLFMGTPEQPETGDRSRTPRRQDKGKGGSKGMGLGRNGKKSGKGAPPEGEEEEKSGRRFFPGPATLPSDWRDKKAAIDTKPEGATMAFKQGSSGIPIFRLRCS